MTIVNPPESCRIFTFTTFYHLSLTIMTSEFYNLNRKVTQYKEVLANTAIYRQSWNDQLKNQILQTLQDFNEKFELNGRAEVRSDIENLEAVILTLGAVKSGMFQRVDNSVDVHLIKHNGSLIYQQLFNGKIIVIIQYPFIENYGQPRPPKTIAIYRPEELKEPFFIRHLEEFIQEITDWEDYDDDEPNKRIGFDLNFGALKPEK
jgi:hypothetical protein